MELSDIDSIEELQEIGRKAGRRAFATFLREFPWIHLSVGVLGNLLFVVGSFFFLSENLMKAGTWMFIVGSLGMFVGVCGEVVVRYDNHRRNKNPDKPEIAMPSA